jgi:predicted DNA-binding transcriptional regulator AlpA
MNQPLSAETGAMIPKPALAAELGVSSRTISRWLADVAVEFPKPIVIRGRNYFPRTAIEAWKSARLRASIKMEAA